MIAAIAVMIIGAYRGIKAIPLTILAAIVVIVTNGLPVWQSLSTTYAGGFGGVVASYFFIFISSAVYALIMEKTGCATAIGYKLVDWFGTKHVMLVSILFVSILTYGGVSVFVVIFATMPILFILFREAGLPRHAVIAPFAVGSSTYATTTLPGTPALTNVIPSQLLGTPMTAAPVFSIVLAIIMFVLCYLYCIQLEKKCKAKAELWTYPAGYDASVLEVDRTTLPGIGVAFAPIILLIAFIVGGSIFRSTFTFANDAALLTTLAMIFATLLCILLNIKNLSITSVKDIIGQGSLNGISAIVGLASVVAFGGVVSSSPAFQEIVTWVLGLDMSPYVKGAFSTAVFAGITGSSSGGVRIMLNAMGDYFMASGVNLEVLHRLVAVAAGTFDSLPHASGIFLVMAMMGLTHKEAYKHFFWITVIIPLIITVIGTVAAMVIWPV
ncbi:GntP family permease [Ruminococcaceae bacterium OttesenSCG-928-O06]|nr:GntP family permease [Ruminococcaceae bacterium OttesenSCG-928-O06]